MGTTPRLHCFSRFIPRAELPLFQWAKASHKYRLSYTTLSRVVEKNANTASSEARTKSATATGLQRLPTSCILRNLCLGYLMTTPALFNTAFAVLKNISKSKSRTLNPDVNPLLRAVMKPLIYDQFCAGRSRPEICGTKRTLKGMGYSGVILGYGKEIQVDLANNDKLVQSRSSDHDLEISEWEKGNLDTIDMIGSGDWLAIKMTGAGSATTGALLRNGQPPAQFLQAIHTICRRAEAAGCRLWIDAEQQAVQASIDKWTVDLMRHFNVTPGKALVYNTLQAYLKSSRDKLKDYLALADKEGWTLGIKLVRGAYINNDVRQLIHDTKEDTDASYDSIVKDLLSGTNLGIAEDRFPPVQLFLAGHNPISVTAAWDLVQTRARENRLKVLPEFGQLQGMGDVLGCEVLQKRAELIRRSEASGDDIPIPKIYKCTTWGTIQECTQYLIRRVVENRGGADRMRDGLANYKSELKRRLLGSHL